VCGCVVGYRRSESGQNYTFNDFEHSVWLVQGDGQAQSLQVLLLMKQVRQLLFPAQHNNTPLHLKVEKKRGCVHYAQNRTGTVRDHLDLSSKKRTSLLPIAKRQRALINTTQKRRTNTHMQLLWSLSYYFSLWHQWFDSFTIIQKLKHHTSSAQRSVHRSCCLLLNVKESDEVAVTFRSKIYYTLIVTHQLFI
jgi:hypothetical protein